MKKPIDIEKLLQWAVRDELPKGRAVSADIGAIVIRRQHARPFAAALDRKPREVDAFGFVPGAPHEDALIVSDAITALDTMARFEDRDEVLALFGDLAGIADDAASAIMTATFDPRSLVISKAAQSSRPQWEFPWPAPKQMWVPFRDAVGSLRERPLVHGTDDQGDIIFLKPNRGRAAQRDGMYDYAMMPRSPLTWCDPSLITIGHARAEYVAWYGALVSLAQGLADRLKEFAPTMPAIRPAPWRTGQTPASRVLDDGFPPGLLTGKLPLAPKRHAPLPPLRRRTPQTLDSADVGL